MKAFHERTAQDLLADRRANVEELRRETDKSARAMLSFYIGEIDAELARREMARRETARTQVIP